MTETVCIRTLDIFKHNQKMDEYLWKMELSSSSEVVRRHGQHEADNV